MLSTPTPRRIFLKRVAALPVAVAAAGWQIRGRAAEPAPNFRTGNARIDANRAVALSLLKPSARDLEHGLRLHAESLVCESYGFAPRFAVDADVINAAVARGASDGELMDLREDAMLQRGAHHAREWEEFSMAFRAAGVTCILQNAGEEGNDPDRLIKRLARFTYLTDVRRAELAKAVCAADIRAARRENRRCLVMTMNGVPLRQAWENTRDEVRLIRQFHQLGIRMMHLTYNRRNPIGDGAGEPGNAGLSDFGRVVVEEMNRTGVIVDVAHSGWQTAHDAAKASKKPVVASHTTCAGVYRHVRSKPDEVIKAICDTGGLVGICVIPRFLGGNGDITTFLDHLDYAVRTFGADHVAIGTDVVYVSRSEEEEVARIPRRSDGRSPISLASSRWEHLWPADDFRAKPQAQQSTAWTNWPLFTVGLVQRGHSDETIRKILGENVLRVLRAHEPS